METAMEKPMEKPTEKTEKILDGIHGLMPLAAMDPYAAKLRAVYSLTPDAPFIQREFGFYALDRWAEAGHPVDPASLDAAGGLEPSGRYTLGGLGWCEAEFHPAFEEQVLEDRGEYELVQDCAGRAVLCFKGRRSGFMPEYVGHPVKDQATWRDRCAWRLDPNTPGRLAALEAQLPQAVAAARRGLFITQGLVGGYMYLRSLIGPEDLLYMFYDDPDLIRACMEAWFALADAVIARHQRQVTLDEIFMAEDICYNQGSLISPDMMREFLFPYYKALLVNARKRQLDPDRHLYFQVDTDGFCLDVIPLYQELGMDVMSPFEAASGSDVVEAARRHPSLVLLGGFDKRILAQGPDAIDREAARIFPVLKKRGGYSPTCDHGVPEEVPYENWLHFRKRCLEY